MSMSDTIADALTRIRNGLHAKHSMVVLPRSRVISEMVRIFKEEGYIEDFITKRSGGREEIHIALKYTGKEGRGKPVITSLSRVSTPGRRVYRSSSELPQVLGGLGVALVSTPQGVMTTRDASAKGLGGEILCEIY